MLCGLDSAYVQWLWWYGAAASAHFTPHRTVENQEGTSRSCVCPTQPVIKSISFSGKVPLRYFLESKAEVLDLPRLELVKRLQAYATEQPQSGAISMNKNHILQNWHFFPEKIPIQFDVARELTFPSLASLIACLSPEPGERSDVYSVSREISQREILKTEGVGIFLLMECVV